jgi:hypothetical protein
MKTVDEPSYPVEGVPPAHFAPGVEGVGDAVRGETVLHDAQQTTMPHQPRMALGVCRRSKTFAGLARNSIS